MEAASGAPKVSNGSNQLPTEDLSPSEELARIRIKDADGPAVDEATATAYAQIKPVEVSSQVLYVKDNVWVWPCRSSRIMGRLSLTLARDILYIAWLPYKPNAAAAVQNNSSGSVSTSQRSPVSDTTAQTPSNTSSTTASTHPQEHGDYAIRPIPITDIEAFRKHTPPIGTHHVAIVMRDGSVHPPLHFFNGGIKAMLAVLKEHVALVKSAVDCNTLVVVGDTAPQLGPQYSADAGTNGVVNGATGGGLAGPGGGSSDESGQELAGGAGRAMSSLGRTSSGAGPPPLHASAYEAPPAQQVFAHPVSDTADGADGPWIGRSMQALTSIEALADRGVRGLQRFLFPEQAEAIAQAEQELSMNTAMADLYSKGPLGRARRLRAASCAGDFSASRASSSAPGGAATTAASDAATSATHTAVGSFELVDEAAPAVARDPNTPAAPLAADEWATFLDVRGRVIDRHALWTRVYKGGVVPGLRKEVWKFLLGVYDIESTAVERLERMRCLRGRYRNIRWQWQSITNDQAAHWAKWRERRSQVEKDVVRTDRDHPLFSAPEAAALGVMHRVLLSYVMYNQDLGYSQGMSDLLSAVLLVTTDETEAFWIFERLMHRVGGNFDRDQSCCQAQLKGLARLVQLLDPPLHAAIRAAGASDYLFAFRWVMVLLKREFVLSEVPALWEALWTNPHTHHLHLYLALALLQYKRHAILSTGAELHSGHMHNICGALRGTVGLHEALQDAEALVMYAGAAGVACLSEVPAPRLPQAGDTPGGVGGDGSTAGEASALEELGMGPCGDSEDAEDAGGEVGAAWAGDLALAGKKGSFAPQGHCKASLKLAGD